ncbi:hypothetical protein [Curtobacterium luteum]|uniref:hypothetical protein n=1 Tax=Curtobacterium luteum TaxID=33881 RepID=UPI003821DD51
MDAGVRPLPRWAEVGSVVVAGVAIVLGIVLRSAPDGEPLDTVRFVFQLIGLGCALVAIAAGLTAMARGRLGTSVLPESRQLDRRTRRRIGAAAVGRVEPPSGTDGLVRSTANRVVTLMRTSVFTLTGMLVLEASALAQRSDGDAWRWLFLLAAVMFLGFLVMTLWQYHGALRVLARSEPAPADEAR